VRVLPPGAYNICVKTFQVRGPAVLSAPTTGRARGTSAPPPALPGLLRTPRAHSAAKSVLTVIALGSLGAACSGGPKPAGVASLGKAPSTTAAASAAQPTINQAAFLAKMLAYTHCMRSHGIADFPDPTPGPNGQGGGFHIRGGPGSDLDPDNPRYEAANRACQALLPYGGALPAPTASQLAEYTKFAACIRQHGFPSFPDPNGQGVFVLHNFDLSSPQFQSAQQTCSSVAHLSGPMRVEATNSGPTAPASP
jgi:hypothetical protein